MKSFINENDNKKLLESALEEGDIEASRDLDQRFQDYFLKVRLIKYADKLARLYVKTYDEKSRKKRSELFLDSTIKGEGQDTLIKDLLVHPQAPLVEEAIHTIEEILPTKGMVDLYKTFSKQKKMVIYLWVYYQLSVKDISEILDSSPQNVSKLKAKALRQLKERGERNGSE